jgi:hypothetical protein
MCSLWVQPGRLHVAPLAHWQLSAAAVVCHGGLAQLRYSCTRPAPPPPSPIAATHCAWARWSVSQNGSMCSVSRMLAGSFISSTTMLPLSKWELMNVPHSVRAERVDASAAHLLEAGGQGGSGARGLGSGGRRPGRAVQTAAAAGSGWGSSKGPALAGAGGAPLMCTQQQVRPACPRRGAAGLVGAGQWRGRDGRAHLHAAIQTHLASVATAADARTTTPDRDLDTALLNVACMVAAVRTGPRARFAEILPSQRSCLST